jgi:hypothetical protein
MEGRTFSYTVLTRYRAAMFFAIVRPLARCRQGAVLAFPLFFRRGEVSTSLFAIKYRKTRQ